MAVACAMCAEPVAIEGRWRDLNAAPTCSSARLEFTWPQACSLLIRRIMHDPEGIMHDPEEYAYCHLVKLAAGPIKPAQTKHATASTSESPQC
jgi:hypothetical protein